MNASADTLTPRQELVITELLSSPSVEESCRRAKVAKATVYGWLKNPAFQAELKRQREALVDEALNRLKAALIQAVATLTGLLEAEGKPAIQLRAAQTLLDQGIKAVELQDLASRIEALEQEVASHRGSRWH
jgi:hypothetical protein